tara:strand:+ start:22 stop:726 length:705 start_codon:yes stop_codon:yes gene_type:complete
MKPKTKYIHKFFILIFLSISTNDTLANDNELSFGIAIGKGIMENVSGLHGPVTGNAGTTIKGLVLDDDSLNTNISLSLDYNKNLKDNFYLNSGVSLVKYSTTDTNITFDGGFNSAFPDIYFYGFIFDLGPSYRFKGVSNFTPYATLNTTYFFGKQSDTEYSGDYGSGGPNTYVRCLGLTPNLGFFVNSGFLRGYGFSVERLMFECENDQTRSMENGYEADFDITQYRIDYRIPF